MWGWTVPRKQAFTLLDHFYTAGFRQVDTATNYPINKNPEDFRASENILLEWISANGIQDLEVMMKVGSINNLCSPEHNLQQSFLLLNLDDYRHRFDRNLHTFMIHWDNRADANQISRSLRALAVAVQAGLKPGLSGIKHPEVYAKLNKSFQLDFRIQVKHHPFYSDMDRYAAFQDKPRFLAYGINAGGLKFSPDTYRADSNLMVRGASRSQADLQPLQDLLPHWNSRKLPLPITRFNQIGMINAYHHPLISGILIGPSKLEQLADSLKFFRQLKQESYQNIYREIHTLTQGLDH